VAYDYTAQPEFAGPGTEPRSPAGERWPEAGGPMLDGQAIAQGQGQGRATVTIGAIPPLLPPEVRDRERAECEARYASGREGLAALIEGTARTAGADPRTARRTADEVLRQVQTAPANLTAAEQRQLLELLERDAAAPQPEPEPAP
jgi:hypothetical protein